MAAIGRIFAGAFFILALVPAQAEEVFVAGVQPDQRPAGAPKLVAQPHQRAWYVKALTGVDPPYPHSLFFLDVQGDWYTPFTVAGMTGRYDIRGWHTSK